MLLLIFSSEVINIHIRKDCLEDGDGANGEQGGMSIDLEKARPVARLGYGQEYTVVLEQV